MRRKRATEGRGAGLATTILVIGVIVTLAFTVAVISISHMQISTRMSNSQVAYNRAEAAVAQAIDQVIQQYEAGGAFQGHIDLPAFPGEPPGSGVVTFDPTDATTLQIPCSTNNLNNENSIPANWGGRTVPGEGIHVLGVGTCNGVTRTVETMVFVPIFPYTMASSGPIMSGGGLKVASVDDPADAANGFDNIPADKLKPGHIASNSTDANGLNLDAPNTIVTGDAVSVGGVLVGQGVVKGQVRPNANQVTLPDVDIASYDTAGKTNLDTVNPGYLLSKTVTGWARCQGDLTIGQGLTLDGGVLYVNGNLTVQDGGLSGRGALFVTGQTQIHGKGNVATDNLTALVSGGTAEITADPADRAQIQGVVYTEGDLTASGVNLTGQVYATAPGGSNVTLTNMDLTQVKTMAQDFTVDVKVGGASSGGSSSGGAVPPPTWNATGYSSYFKPSQFTAPKVYYKITGVMSTPPPSPPAFFVGPGQPYTVGPEDLDYEVSVGPSATGPWGTPVTSSYANLHQTVLNEVKNAAGSNWTSPTDDNSFTTNGYVTVDTKVTQTLSSGLPSVGPTLTALTTNYPNAPPPDYPTGGGGGTTTETFTFSIKDATLTATKDKLKVLMWKEL